MELQNIQSTTHNLDSAFVDFSIKQTPIMFDILSNKLYSDPILAIVRELMTNAYDSHVVKGNTDTPISVTIPSYLSEEFIIRDYGTGLSKEDMTNLYTTFFDSTKSDDNNLTGGFGLGSKTPFAYTDMFTVSSYFDGLKSTYAIFKNNGKPTLTLLSEEPTEEPTGLSIAIRVEPSDYGVFTKKVNHFRRYNPEVLVEGDLLEVDKAEATIGQISLYNTSPDLQGNIHFKQGQNIFSLPSNTNLQTGELLAFEASVKEANVDVIIEVPIGTLSVAPNRETFQVTDTIATKLNEFILSFKDEVFDLILTAPPTSFLYNAATKIKIDKHISFPKLGFNYYKKLRMIASETSGWLGVREWYMGKAKGDEYTSSNGHYNSDMVFDPNYKTFFVPTSGILSKAKLRTLTKKLQALYDTDVMVYMFNFKKLVEITNRRRYSSYFEVDSILYSKQKAKVFVDNHKKLINSLNTHFDMDIHYVSYKALTRRAKLAKIKTSALLNPTKQLRTAETRITQSRYSKGPTTGLVSLGTLDTELDTGANIIIVANRGADLSLHLRKWLADNVMLSKKTNSLVEYINKEYDTEFTFVNIYCVADSNRKEVNALDNPIKLDMEEYSKYLKSLSIIPKNLFDDYRNCAIVKNNIDNLFKPKFKSNLNKAIHNNKLIKLLKKYGEKYEAIAESTIYFSENTGSHLFFDKQQIRNLLAPYDYEQMVANNNYKDCKAPIERKANQTWHYNHRVEALRKHITKNLKRIIYANNHD